MLSFVRTDDLDLGKQSGFSGGGILLIIEKRRSNLFPGSLEYGESMSSLKWRGRKPGFTATIA